MEQKDALDEALKRAVKELIEQDAAEAAAIDTAHVPTTERMQRLGEALKRADRDVTGAILLPGYPEGCQGNGQHPDFECCCDECSYLAECFPTEHMHA